MLNFRCPPNLLFALDYHRLVFMAENETSSPCFINKHQKNNLLFFFLNKPDNYKHNISFLYDYNKSIHSLQMHCIHTILPQTSKTLSYENIRKKAQS